MKRRTNLTTHALTHALTQAVLTGLGALALLVLFAAGMAAAFHRKLLLALPLRRPRGNETFGGSRGLHSLRKTQPYKPL